MKSFSDDSSNESTVPNKKIKSENIYADEIEFSISFIKKNFTKDELKSGIFPDKNNKTRSKNKIPFDADKTENLKSKLMNFYLMREKFNLILEYSNSPEFNTKLNINSIIEFGINKNAICVALKNLSNSITEQWRISIWL